MLTVRPWLLTSLRSTQMDSLSRDAKDVNVRLIECECERLFVFQWCCWPGAPDRTKQVMNMDGTEQVEIFKLLTFPSFRLVFGCDVFWLFLWLCWFVFLLYVEGPVLPVCLSLPECSSLPVTACPTPSVFTCALLPVLALVLSPCMCCVALHLVLLSTVSSAVFGVYLLELLFVVGPWSCYFWACLPGFESYFSA